MNSLQKIKNLFLYAGVEKEAYHGLLPMIREKNQELLRVYSLFGTVMFLLLFLVSMITGGFAAANSLTYLLCGSGMLILLILSFAALPKNPQWTALLVRLFEILLYIFGIRISLLHAEKTAVSAVAFLLVSPLLFYDQPVRLSALTMAVVAAFCAIVSQFKKPDVAEADIWNMITFGLVAVFTTVYMMSIKIRTLTQSGQIEYMSRTDLLTGARNRNHYENRLAKYPGMCASGLICVYADVNGLHEMNNREGHMAGDRMLCEVASALRERFDPEHIYRVGGDEFIAFRPDGREEGLAEEIAGIQEQLSRKGYHVSMGGAFRPKTKDPMNMHDLVNEAESRMFTDKQEFYNRAENDRRSR